MITLQPLNQELDSLETVGFHGQMKDVVSQACQFSNHSFHDRNISCQCCRVDWEQSILVSHTADFTSDISLQKLPHFQQLSIGTSQVEGSETWNIEVSCKVGLMSKNFLHKLLMSERCCIVKRVVCRTKRCLLEEEAVFLK